MPIKYEIKPVLPSTDGRPDNLPRPALKLARRMLQLAAVGDAIHTVQIAFLKGEWIITVNNGKVERLGNIDQTT
jgi:hypothetical protein